MEQWRGFTVEWLFSRNVSCRGLLLNPPPHISKSDAGEVVHGEFTPVPSARRRFPPCRSKEQPSDEPLPVTSSASILFSTSKSLKNPWPVLFEHLSWHTVGSSCVAGISSSVSSPDIELAGLSWEVLPTDDALQEDKGRPETIAGFSIVGFPASTLVDGVAGASKADIF